MHAGARLQHLLQLAGRKSRRGVESDGLDEEESDDGDEDGGRPQGEIPVGGVALPGVARPPEEAVELEAEEGRERVVEARGPRERREGVRWSVTRDGRARRLPTPARDGSLSWFTGLSQGAPEARGEARLLLLGESYELDRLLAGDGVRDRGRGTGDAGLPRSFSCSPSDRWSDA